jgi:hypothetical protein
MERWTLLFLKSASIGDIPPRDEPSAIPQIVEAVLKIGKMFVEWRLM